MIGLITDQVEIESSQGWERSVYHCEKRRRVPTVISCPACLAHHPSLSQFQNAYREWVEAGLSRDIVRREDRCSEPARGLVEQVKNELGSRAQHREVTVADGLYLLREPVPRYEDHFDRETRL